MIRKTLASTAAVFVAVGLTLGVVVLGNTGTGPQTVQASVSWGSPHR